MANTRNKNRKSDFLNFDKPLKVLFIPDFQKANPYQKLLSKQLQLLNCSVVFPKTGKYFKLFKFIKSNGSIYNKKAKL